MLGSDVLELGIGVSLFFLLVSLLCSAVREAIETAMKSRAGDLERGLRSMLDDPQGTTIMRSLLQHGHLSSLFDGDYDPSGLKKTMLGYLYLPRKLRVGFPSYIPPTQFATALLDTIARGPADWPYPVDPRPLSIDQLRASAGLLPSPRLQRVVLSAIDHGAGDLAAVRAELEKWFNGSMDRVSGWYKRRTQYVLFAIGLIAAALLNLDALTVAHRLIDDEGLRKAVVAEASVVQGAGADALKGRTVTDVRNDLGSIGYPIGWRTLPNGGGFVPDPQTCHGRSDGCPDTKLSASIILAMILGWLVTAIATTFGAPFWFDILNKFMVVRSTVKPRQKSHDEASADASPDTPAAPAPETDPQAPAKASAQPGAGQKEAAAPPAAGPAPAPLPDIAPGDIPETWREGFVNAAEIRP
ncbi:MAG: hypothetical protein JWO81_2096 [Alphaproteobacteria bacterium]|nr:hypothetical protein [Alphaproteobacteria bacterium]